ncbi:MAG: hypothetical protein CMJ58_06640 [Planctomycetaceae bacterium]|nr:hypothetical protein [Planctomycetaceae bacterium]
MSRNLVLSIVGDQSVHRSWLSEPDARQFDLALVYFGDQPGQWADDGEYYLRRKGIKFQLLYDLLQGEWAHLIERYDRFWLPDDDIACDTATVNQMFRTAAEFQLQVCQPAIGKGDFSFAALRAHPQYRLRYTGYVEIMCPLFTRKALIKSAPVFAANRSAWGIDWVWSTMHGEDEVAVIDETPVHHTRPLQSGGVHSLLAKLGIDPGAEYHELLQRFGIKNRRQARRIFRDTARLKGIDVAGNEVWTRSRLSQWIGRRAA